MATFERAEQVRREIAERLRAMPGFAGAGVVGVAGGYGVKVNLTVEPADPGEIPPEYHGVPVETELVGYIRAY